MNFVVNKQIRLIFFALLTVAGLPLAAQSGDCSVSGGRLITANGTSYVPVCIDDMTEEVTDIDRSDFSGENSVYFMTTAAGFIVQVMEGSPPFDFRELQAGVRAIWSVAYTGDLTGADIGDNICATGSTGCFNLSNPVVLNRATGEDCDVFCQADAGSIALANGNVDTTICLISGTVSPVDIVLLQDPNADNVDYILTSNQGRILDIVTGDGPFDFSGQGAGVCLIWQLAYATGLQGLEVGNTAEDFRGCYSLSNPITVSREAVTAGSIVIANADGGGTAISICTADGQSDEFDVELTPGDGDNSQWVIVDRTGSIIALPTAPPFNLEGAGIGQCRIYHLTYTNGLTGLRPLSSINDIVGCYELSNPIVVTRRSGSDCPDVFTANLGGSQIAPCPLTSTGRGTFSAALDGNTLTVTGSFSNLATDFNPAIGGGLQLHLGLAGQEGPFILPLTPLLDADQRGGLLLTADNRLNLTNDQRDAFLNRGMYVTVHTEDQPNGAIRGQFLPERRYIKFARLNGANLTPALPTQAFGAVVLERRGNTVVLSGSVANLNEQLGSDTSGTVFLRRAVAGRQGAILFPLNLEAQEDGLGATILPDSNTYVLTPGQIDSLNRDLLYITVQTDFAPEGEVRGQLTDLTFANFYVELNGQQVRPEPVNTLGLGRMVVGFDGSQLTLSGSVDELDGAVQSTGLRLGFAGSTGPALFPLSITPDADGHGGIWLAADNTFSLSEEQISSLFDRELYVTAATSQESGGEVRGQLLHLANGYFGANLTGGNENPAFVTSRGSGYILFELCDDEIIASGSFNDLESNFNTAIGGGSHLHAGTAHTNGGIMASLSADVSPDRRSGVYRGSANRISLSPSALAALDEGGLYVNLRSLAHPNGELRGQVLRGNNAFPTAASITYPRNGTSFTIFEDGSTDQVGRFQGATDPDGDEVVYALEFATAEDAAYEQPLAIEKIGTQTSSTTAIKALHDTLRARGTSTGMAVDLTYRIISSDGSVSTYGQSENFTLSFGDFPEACSVRSGTLAIAGGGDLVTITCISDGVSDAFSLELDDYEGTNLSYLVTDVSGNIILLTDNPVFDFEGTGVGESLIYGLSYETGLLGAVVGLNLTDLKGCFALSNSVRVIREDNPDCVAEECAAKGGTLIVSGSDLGTDLTFCASDGIADAFTLILGNNGGTNTTYVVTDALGKIQWLTEVPIFDFEGAGAGTNLIWALSYENGLLGASPGLNLEDLQGCYDLSNPIRINRTVGEDCNDASCTATGGDLRLGDNNATEITTCAGDGRPDPFTLSISNHTGENLLYLITDASGRILGTQEDPNFDFEGAGSGTSFLYGLSYTNGLLGATIGNFIDRDLQGCYALSNAVSIIRQTGDDCVEVACTLAGGTLLTTSGEATVIACAGDGFADPVNVSLIGANAPFSSYLLAAEDGSILALFTAPPFDLEPYGPGQHLLYGLSYESGLTGAIPSLNLAGLIGCYALSTPVVVNALESGLGCGGPICTAEGGTLSLPSGATEIGVCVGDGTPDPFTLLLNGNAAELATYVVTDTQGNILSVTANGDFNFEGETAGTSLVYALSFEASMTGLATGGNLADLGGCFALSNPVRVNRFSDEGCIALCAVAGGTLALSNGDTELTLCVGDGVSDVFTALSTGANGSNFLYLVADTDGTILRLTANGRFDLENEEAGMSLIYGLSFEDNFSGATIGNNISDLAGCYALSAPMRINSRSVADCPDETVVDAIITEINYYGAVEIVNAGNEQLDMSTIYLGKSGDMRSVASFSIACGKIMTRPGEVITVFVGSLFDRTSGELALSTTANPAFGTELLSYVAWGDGPRPWEPMADSGQLWEENTFMNAPVVSSSIQLINSGYPRQYELKSPTPCEATGVITSIFGPEAGAADMIEVYPNPFGDMVVVEMNRLKGPDTDVSLFDLQGRRVFQRTIHMRNGRMRIHSAHLPSGTYVLRISSAGGVSAYRVMRY